MMSRVGSALRFCLLALAALLAAEAERLIAKEKVGVLFACWTSACRKAVKPVVEKHRHLIFYPVQYEVMEQSPNILYTGAAPNQQVVPGTRWAMQTFGKRVFLVGSDYIFPRTANLIVRDLVAAPLVLAASILGAVLLNFALAVNHRPGRYMAF